MNHNLFHIPGHTTIRKIGEGGMGSVFLATDNMLQREVAVKVLKSSVDQGEDSMLRFQSEAITLAKLRHPHITMLYNLIQVDGRWCMIMEYVTGETVDVLLKSNGRLAVKQVLEMAIPVLDALQHAHSRGVVHRDLKPSNLMLSADGEVKIMDFGIARITGVSRLTRVGQAVGTPQYMSPEQVVGYEGNYASDIYSFGIVLYELLTGITPFDSESEFEVMQAHTNRKPVPPASLNPDIPAALNSAILRALEKEPSKRFNSAEEFKRCLLQIGETDVAGTPVGKHFSFKWKLPDIPLHLKLPAIPIRLKFPEMFDRQYIAGAAFLTVSLIVALFVIFSTPKSKTPEIPITREEKELLIEIEPDTDMGRLFQERTNPKSVTSPPNTTVKISTPSNVPVSVDKKEPVRTPTSKPVENEEKAEPVISQKIDEHAKEPVKPSITIEPNKTPTGKTEPKPVNNSLGKQVVIARGTRIDAVLNNTYDYDSVQDGMRVTLQVETPLERSGVVVIHSGAKVNALIHKSTRKRELELEILEVESVTGKRLKSMNTTFKASAFARGEIFKINLDYNRLN